MLTINNNPQIPPYFVFPAGQDLKDKPLEKKYTDDSGTILIKETNGKKSMEIYDKQGNLSAKLGIKNPQESNEEYLNMLAEKLNTYFKLAVFFENFLKYADETGEYMQLPAETINRIEGNYMLGDCEDWALLGQEILKRQNRLSHVICMEGKVFVKQVYDNLHEEYFIPGHAVCTWSDQLENGNYVVYSLGTDGLYQGNRKLSESKTGDDFGENSIYKAFSSTFNKYSKVLNTNSVSLNVLNINETHDIKTYLIPLPALNNSELYSLIMKIYELEEAGRSAETGPIYVEIQKKYNIDWAFARVLEENNKKPKE